MVLAKYWPVLQLRPSVPDRTWSRKLVRLRNLFKLEEETINGAPSSEKLDIRIAQILAKLGVALK